MDMTVKFMRKMFKVEEDALGAKGFYPFRFGFYDFLKESGMETKEYEEFIKGLRDKGLITINLNGNNNLAQAVISPEKFAAEYILEHERNPKIGFER